MDPLQLLLAGLTGAAVAFLLPRLLRGRSGHSVVESALARIDARLDEQARGQLEQAQSLRLEIEQRLSTGFDRADRTQADVVKRLALIDQAQQRLTELSSNVVSLQEVLADRSSRGAFGEVQLHALVSNVLPAGSFKMQYTLSTGRRADCMLFLPQPTGNIAIDSKFPLANFRRKVDPRLPAAERQQAGKAFARDVKTHISDVADKYILPGETCDSAVLFLPAEAVFAEIHAACPELVELAQQRCVWLTSPTTLMAVLTTARAVLRDAATRREVHAIQGHLRTLGTEFGRFEASIDKLAVHIRQAGEDITRARQAADRITGRFREIDELELPAMEAPSSDRDSPASAAIDSPAENHGMRLANRSSVADEPSVQAPGER